MPKPLIALFSTAPRLTDQLPALLGQQFTFLASDCQDELDELLAAHQPQAVVIDVRSPRNGGHFEARLVERLQQRFSSMPMVLLLPQSCPEPLQRLAACHSITPMSDSVDLERLATVVKEQIAERAETNPSETTTADHHDPASRPSSNQGPAAASDGRLARRFSTQTPALKAMFEELEVAAKHDVTILLIGETGSGKTFASRLIHETSPRHGQPFLHVACGALPSELIESELFGHVKGAFTSAHADKEGKFIAAGRGTILLDEIDVLGPEQQVKLLRVIETGQFEPVGSNQTLQSQARLVVASNLDLEPLVEQGQFRPDLYYRLNMLKFEIPPLRDRKPDIAPLARTFVTEMANKHGVTIERIENSFLEALHTYPWPGNIRELENVVQRAVIFCSDGVLTARHLPSHVISASHELPEQTGGEGPPLSATGSERDQGNLLNRQMAVTEREIIEQTLLKNNYSRTQTARELGVSRVTLYNKMKKYGMSPSPK